jgi:hypothetical protein
MVSEPVTDPPGLSTRSTMATTSSSAAASRRAAAMVSAPALEFPIGNTCGPPRPLTIEPARVTTAIVERDLRPGRPGSGDPPPAVALAYRARYSRGGASLSSRSASASPDSGETPSAPTFCAIRA